jgi:hypothetical protein
MEPEGSLPHAQQPAGCPCSEPINAVYWLKAKLFTLTAGLKIGSLSTFDIPKHQTAILIDFYRNK